MRVMKVSKYIQARYILLAVPATLAISAVALGQSATKHSHNNVTSTTHLETSGTTKPTVTVNGHHVNVPAGGSTTVSQTGGSTTVTVAPETTPPNQGSGSSLTTTTSPNGTVSVSVTSNSGTGHHNSHSTANVNSHGDTFSNVHQNVTVQKTGTGSVQASN